VHLACAVFIPEVSFSDAKRLRIVEGISTIPTHRWSTVRGGHVLTQTTNTKMLNRSDARYAAKLAAQSSDAVIALPNITSHARGLAGTSSALRSKRYYSSFTSA
jgi:hypothetical protein